MSLKSKVTQIFTGAELTSEDVTFLESILEEIHIPKGTTLLSANELVSEQYYVLQGCLRTYFIDE